MITMRVGFVGWRGMVGSVLLSRMLEERDFERLDPVFFSTSSAGGAAPVVGAATRPGTPVGAQPATLQRGPWHDVTPLSPDRYRLQLTIGGATLEKLRLAQDMLRHAIPSGDEAAVLDRALTVLLADLARARFAATNRPGPGQAPTPGSRHIPADVKRVVWLRDLGRCAFVGTGGHRCNERAFVEFHHLRPYAVGGEATPDNIQLRCRRHNGYESRTFFSGRCASRPWRTATDQVNDFGSRAYVPVKDMAPRNGGTSPMQISRDFPLSFQCAQCGLTFREPYTRVQQQQAIDCPRCNGEVPYDKVAVDTEIRGAEAALRAFEREIVPVHALRFHRHDASSRGPFGLVKALAR
jgi:DNA-directed RNA polymerase subunit RPC12/RpoP